MLRLTPPTTTTLVISAILAILALAGHYSPEISSLIPMNIFWLVVIAYVVLLLGNLIRGL
jgi:hypothetical protein